MRKLTAEDTVAASQCGSALFESLCGLGALRANGIIAVCCLLFFFLFVVVAVAFVCYSNFFSCALK